MLARPGANHALSGLSSACVFGAGEADCVFGAAAGEANCVFVAGEVDCVFGVGEVDCVYGAATGDVDCVFGADEADCVFGAGEADCVFSRQVLAEGLDALSRTVPASRALSKLLFRGERRSLTWCSHSVHSSACEPLNAQIVGAVSEVFPRTASA